MTRALLAAAFAVLLATAANAQDKVRIAVGGKSAVYYLPLEPKRNEGSKAMDANNANRALNMGPVGIAINGVAFFNPFDAGMTDAHDIMDRCCGHPAPVIPAPGC